MSAPSEPVDLAATYNDGKTADPRKVSVRIEAGWLVIGDEHGVEIDRWPAAEVRSVAVERSDRTVRLRRGFDRDDRLTLDDPRDLARLLSHCPFIRRTTPGWGSYRLPVVVWGLGAFASIALLVLVVVPWLAREIAFAIPASLEERIGERVADQVIDVLARTGGADPSRAVCAADPGRLAFDGLVGRLTRGLPGAAAPRVTVVDSKLVNALALPGGRIVVLRGLIDFAQDGDELAGVLAHEIGHLVERHPTAVALERAGVSLLIGLVVGDVFGGTAIAGLGQMLVGAAYGRGAETEADAIGARLLERAEIDARPLGRFLERLKGQGELTGALVFFSTHPPLAERAAQARASGAPTRPALGPDEWRAIKAMCG